MFITKLKGLKLKEFYVKRIVYVRRGEKFFFFFHIKRFCVKQFPLDFFALFLILYKVQ